jgi:hypothetical protein
MLDVAVAYDRYRFLGHEFLTWLWFMIELHPEGLQTPDQAVAGIDVGNRIVLENRLDGREETITIKGDDAGWEEGLLALKKGAVVTEINLVYRSGDLHWRFTLKGESLNLSSVKLPEIHRPETREDMEGFVLDKIGLYENVIDFIEKTFTAFIRLRVSDQWDRKIVPQMKSWISGPGRSSGS